MREVRKYKYKRTRWRETCIEYKHKEEAREEVKEKGEEGGAQKDLKVLWWIDSK